MPCGEKFRKLKATGSQKFKAPEDSETEFEPFTKMWFKDNSWWIVLAATIILLIRK